MHSHPARTAPGYVMANTDDGVTVTDAEGHTLTVAATGGDRIDVRSSRALRLDPGTVRAFATALLGFADYTENHPDTHGVGHRTVTDDDVCAVADCDARLDDGEGYGGYRGDHADLIESHREGNHLDVRRGPNPECPICWPDGGC